MNFPLSSSCLQLSVQAWVPVRVLRSTLECELILTLCQTYLGSSPVEISWVYLACHSQRGHSPVEGTLPVSCYLSTLSSSIFLHVLYMFQLGLGTPLTSLICLLHCDQFSIYVMVSLCYKKETSLTRVRDTFMCRYKNKYLEYNQDFIG